MVVFYMNNSRSAVTQFFRPGWASKFAGRCTGRIVAWPVTMPVTFDQLLGDNTPVLMDGAMGTELNRRGVDTTLPLWSAAALHANAGTVLDIHREYVAAGARMITANTFRTTTFTYQQSGLDLTTARQRAQEATSLAVELAKRAAGGEALVAGSMAPVADCYTPADYPGDASAESIYDELAHWLMEAGADMLLVETHITLAESALALERARTTGLPVAASFLVDESMRLWGGAPLQEAVRTAEAAGVAAILVNCVTLPTGAIALQALKELTRLPVGVYANAGLISPEKDGAIEKTYPDQEFVVAALQWVDAGAKLIGGCCGTTPATIKAVKEALSTVDRAPNQM